MPHACPRCRFRVTVGRRLGVVLGTAAVTTLFGAAATRHPVGALLALVIGLKLGDEIDKAIARTCPECGAVLQLLALAT
jgi:DNA-directed RNA polymerase subunit RPC12/RpoP